MRPLWAELHGQLYREIPTRSPGAAPLAHTRSQLRLERATETDEYVAALLHDGTEIHECVALRVGLRKMSPRFRLFVTAATASAPMFLCCVTGDSTRGWMVVCEKCVVAGRASKVNDGLGMRRAKLDIACVHIVARMRGKLADRKNKKLARPYGG